MRLEQFLVARRFGCCLLLLTNKQRDTQNKQRDTQDLHPATSNATSSPPSPDLR